MPQTDRARLQAILSQLYRRQALPVEPGRTSSAIGRRSVLLLDSCPESRSAYIDALEAAELTLITAANDEEAFATACERAPELAVVIFDSATRAQRFAFCERLKSDPRTRSLAVLLGSADLDESDVRRATDLAVLATALPPGQGAKLLAAIWGILSVDNSSPLEQAMSTGQGGPEPHR